MDEIKSIVKKYISEEFLYGEDPSALADDWSLLESETLDSIRTIKLVDFLEKQFDIRFQAHEVVGENLDTVNDIAAAVSAKLQEK